jgi:hypothetical protein
MQFMSEQCLDPLAVNISGLFCPKQVFDCQLHQNIPNRRGIEYIGIQQRHELANASRTPYPVPLPVRWSVQHLQG